MPTYAVRFRIGLTLIAGLALWGLLRRPDSEAVTDPYEVDARLKQLEPVSAEAPGPTLGYVSDAASDARLVFTAQFALAPKLLVRNPGASDFTIGDFLQPPADPEDFGAQRGLRVVKILNSHTVLYETSPR